MYPMFVKPLGEIINKEKTDEYQNKFAMLHNMQNYVQV